MLDFLDYLVGFVYQTQLELEDIHITWFTSAFEFYLNGGVPGVAVCYIQFDALDHCDAHDSAS